MRVRARGKRFAKASSSECSFNNRALPEIIPLDFTWSDPFDSILFNITFRRARSGDMNSLRSGVVGRAHILIVILR